MAAEVEHAVRIEGALQLAVDAVQRALQRREHAGAAVLRTAWHGRHAAAASRTSAAGRRLLQPALRPAPFDQQSPDPAPAWRHLRQRQPPQVAPPSTPHVRRRSTRRSGRAAPARSRQPAPWRHELAAERVRAASTGAAAPARRSAPAGPHQALACMGSGLAGPSVELPEAWPIPKLERRPRPRAAAAPQRDPQIEHAQRAGQHARRRSRRRFSSPDRQSSAARPCR